MQFIDLGRQYAKIETEIEKSIKNVLNHRKFIMGPEVKRLEEELSFYVDTKYCTCCSSGTDALLMGLMALGIKPGDGIITTPFTFVATAEVISLLGAVPVFVDISSSSFNIDPDAVEECIVSNYDKAPNGIKGIIAVDLFGLPSDYTQLEAISEKYGLFLLEDAAQGLGGEMHGRMAGSFGQIATTSFFPAKPLGCYGDGGAVFTNDGKLHEVLQSIRIHGKGQNKYDNVRVGLNARLDTIQAAILLAKLTVFKEEINQRNVAATLYSEGLSGAVVVPNIPEGYKSAWAQYSILLNSSDDRERCQKALKATGIPSAIYYPIPLHLQDVYQNLGYVPGSMPISEDFSNRILSLPMHPYLENDEINQVVSTVKSALK